jgi:hypothetical protein
LEKRTQLLEDKIAIETALDKAVMVTMPKIPQSIDLSQIIHKDRDKLKGKIKKSLLFQIKKQRSKN